MKSIFLIALSLFALFAFSSAKDLLIQGRMDTKAGATAVALPTAERATIRIPPKLVGVTMKFIMFNLKMRPRFEDGTINHSKYKKRVQRFARRAERVAFKDLEKPDDKKESNDGKASPLNIAARKLTSHSFQMPVVSRDACGRCRAACSGAAASCRGGCLFTGPEGVVECEIAWAVVAAGCFGTCAVRFC